MKTNKSRITKFRTVRGLFKDASHWVKYKWAQLASGSVYDMNEILNQDVPECSCFCLEGAIAAVYRNNPVEREKATRRVVKAIKRLFPEYKIRMPESETIIAFNDFKDRTITDIRKVVKLAKV